MTYIKRYIINQTPSFEIELESIYKYLAFNLNEPFTAKKFFHNIAKEIYSLQYLPERFAKILNPQNKAKNLRKLFVYNYVIIYEVNNDTNQVFILHIFHSSQNYLNKL